MKPYRNYPVDDDQSTKAFKKLPIGCRNFVLHRAKAFLGKSFKHLGTGQTLEDGYFLWSVQVAKCFGGLHVSYGGWVVWSVTKGWLAQPLKL